MKIKPIILCGGEGTRLWADPKNNEAKQFINFGGWNLFEKTLERIKGKIFDYPIISTNFKYLKKVKFFLKKSNIKKFNIILEPAKKNTAPAVLTAALIKKIPSKQPLIFFPSDHLLKKTSQFNKSMMKNKKYLNEKNIFIFGIKPTSPSKEYGYFITKNIGNNLNKVTKFIEKPSIMKARKIIKQNGYWNSGMFLARKDSIVLNFKKYQNKIFKKCVNSVAKSKFKKNIYWLNKSSFSSVTAKSFDYAVLEKSKNINAIKLNIPWSDLGNWKEILKLYLKDKSKYFNKKNIYYRPWGRYINLFKGKNFLIKELIINPKSSISLQKHNYRSEHWMIVEGKPRVTLNKKKLFKNKDDSVFIPVGTTHRIENLYKKPVRIMEVQTGSVLKESDIIRYKDIYGRIK